MGLREDLQRFREVGEKRREDLAEFIQYGDLGPSGQGQVQIPIKIISLPEFRYAQHDTGGVGQADGDVQPGDPVDQPQPGDGDDEGDGDEAGEGGGEHGYYEMDPEEFAEALDDELGLDLEPKGKAVVEETEGDMTDIARTGPKGTLDFEYLFKEGLKRKLAMDFDREYVREALRVDGWGPDAVFAWARDGNVPVSKGWIQEAYAEIPADERTTWASVEEMEANVERTTVPARLHETGLDHVPFRREDERYRHPESGEQRERNAVVVNIRDVSGSMGEDKRELVERTFSPLDWYLQGKYDRAEFVYIAHDAEAWEVERADFFGIRSGGGTRVSSAYELAAEILTREYPWTEWNRYVFAAGDSENSSNDTEERVIPLMAEIDANLQAYVETQPGGNGRNATHAHEVADHFDDVDDVVVTRVNEPEDVTDAIYEILSTEVEET